MKQNSNNLQETMILDQIAKRATINRYCGVVEWHPTMYGPDHCPCEMCEYRADCHTTCIEQQTWADYYSKDPKEYKRLHPITKK